jgi:hypothetical protein
MFSLEHEAAAMLESQGYVVFVFGDPDFPGSLFASRDDQGIFISLVRVRQPYRGVDAFMRRHAGMIRTFRNVPLPKEFTVEIWVYSMSMDSWKHYQVSEHTVTEVEHAAE